MGQLTGTIHRFSTGARSDELSRFRDKSGTKSGQVRMADFCGFLKVGQKARRNLGQGRDSGTSGTKGFSLVPLVPPRLRAVCTGDGK